MTKDAVENYYDVMQRHLGIGGVRRLRHQMDLQYQNIDFANKRVIDIGGGNGVHSLYVAAKGATKVLLIEPESAGSTEGVVDLFKAWKSEIGNQNIELLTTTFQDYEHAGATFDAIIIQDAINHLDEDGCTHLLSNKNSQQVFAKLFHKLASISHPGTILHFSDCSSRNFYPSVGLSNPFDPGIEWEKHQPPSIWIEMLKEVGFQPISTRWSTPTRLGKLGKVLSHSPLAAFFFTSHFIVTMVKK